MEFRAQLRGLIDDESANRNRIKFMLSHDKCDYDMSNKSIGMSLKLSTRKEKWLRYAFNLDLPRAEEYFKKTQETYLECLDLIMDPDASCLISVDANAQDEFDVDALHNHRNEGAVVEFGEQMMLFKRGGEAIMRVVRGVTF